MVRVHSGLPFQVAAPFFTCDSLPVFSLSQRRLEFFKGLALCLPERVFRRWYIPSFLGFIL